MELTREGTASIWDLMPKTIAPPITQTQPLGDAWYPSSGEPPVLEHLELSLPLQTAPVTQEAAPPLTASRPPQEAPPLHLRTYGNLPPHNYVNLSALTASIDGEEFPLTTEVVSAIACLLADECVAYHTRRAESIKARFTPPAS
jgi:hypothetical protein